MLSLQVPGVCLLLVCFVSVVLGVHETLRNGDILKLTHVLDDNVVQALNSVHDTWSVKQLDLSGNAISKIDAQDLVRYENLQVLNLSTNFLTDILDVSQLQRLQTLDVNNNDITKLYVGPAVRNLYAANNKIKIVGCARSSARQKRFNLANNQINLLKDIESTCRAELEELHLDLNDIDFVDFADLSDSKRSLKYLNLQDNFIYDVSNSDQVSFTQLETLDMSSNKLAFLGPAFMAADGAKRIDLENNMLISIDDNSILRNVKELNLRNNGFDCGTLEKFFSKNQRHIMTANKEDCGKKPQRGGYCCEILNASFADRLIALRRRQFALYDNSNAAMLQEQCEKDLLARLKKMDEIRSKYIAQVEATIRLQQDKHKLESQLQAMREDFAMKEDLLKGVEAVVIEAAGTGIRFNNSLQTMQEIVDGFEYRYREQQTKLNYAISDLNRYQFEVDVLQEENRLLEKQHGEFDELLQVTLAKLKFIKAGLAYFVLLLENKT